MEKRFNFNIILNGFLIMIPINIFAILMMTAYRVFFFLYFANFASVSSMKLYVLKAFIMGFRFDLSILAYINIPITILMLVCLLLQSKAFYNMIISFFKYYYFLIFSMLFFVIFVDMGFFSYFKDHYNFLIFGLFEDDTFALAKTIYSDYRAYILTAVFLILCTVFYNIACWTYRELKFNERIINTTYWKQSSKSAFIITVILLNFLCARGSFSMFPLGIFYSQISPDYFINKLCINPIHSLADTIYYKIKNSTNSADIKNLFNYTAKPEDLKIIPKNADIEKCEDLYTKRTWINKAAEKIKPNVVLIVMEGFGEMPVLYNSSSFNVLGELKTHFKKDTVFYNFLAAGSISIQAVETTVLNVPQRPFVNQITQTENAFKQFKSSAVLPYKNAGYEIISLYGGSMTWRDLESFFKAQGFDRILSEGNVLLESKDRHSWGITDAKFFELLKKELKDDSSDKPKFIYAMSTGAHPPYKTPAGYEPLPLEVPAQIASMMSAKDLNNKALFEVYQNANRELAKFLKDIKNSKLAENTIIAVTGDHNLREISNYSSEDMFLRYAVPFYLYIPEQLKPKKINTNVYGSHLDIMPTLYNLSLSNMPYTAFGNNLMTIENNVISNVNGLVMQDECAIAYNFQNNTFDCFKFNEKTKKLEHEQKTEKHSELAAYYKTFLITCDNFIKSK